MKHIVRQKFEDLVQLIPKNKCLSKQKLTRGLNGGFDGCSGDDDRVRGAYGHGVKNNLRVNGSLLVATSCKLALNDTFFSPRNGGLLHAHMVPARMAVSGILHLNTPSPSIQGT